MSKPPIKDNQILIRISADEKRSLQEVAKAAGLPLSRFARAALREGMRRPLSDVEVDLLNKAMIERGRCIHWLGALLLARTEGGRRMAERGARSVLADLGYGSDDRLARTLELGEPSITVAGAPRACCLVTYRGKAGVFLRSPEHLCSSCLAEMRAKAAGHSVTLELGEAVPGAACERCALRC